MKNIELLEQAILLNSKEDSNELIKQFLLSNQLQSSKFNLYDFCDKDQIRPLFTGVNYSNGFKAATDGYVLIKLKESYNPDLEGKTIDKKGAEIEGIYPKYNDVIPDDKYLTYYSLDCDRVIELYQEYKLAKKLDKSHEGYVIIQNVSFRVDLLAKMCRYAKFIGTDQIGLQDSKRAAKFSNNESCGIIMPIGTSLSTKELHEYKL